MYVPPPKDPYIVAKRGTRLRVYGGGGWGILGSWLEEDLDRSVTGEVIDFPAASVAVVRLDQRLVVNLYDGEYHYEGDHLILELRYVTGTWKDEDRVLIRICQGKPSDPFLDGKRIEATAEIEVLDNGYCPATDRAPIVLSESDPVTV